jgi:hypothetical protein
MGNIHQKERLKPYEESAIQQAAKATIQNINSILAEVRFNDNDTLCHPASMILDSSIQDEPDEEVTEHDSTCHQYPILQPPDITTLSSLSPEALRKRIHEIKQRHDPSSQEYIALHFGMHIDASPFQHVKSTAIIVSVIESAILDTLIDPNEDQRKAKELYTKLPPPFPFFLTCNEHQKEAQPLQKKSDQLKHMIYGCYKDLCHLYSNTSGMNKHSFKILGFQRLFKRITIYRRLLESYRQTIGITNLETFHPDNYHIFIEEMTRNVTLDTMSVTSTSNIKNFYKNFQGTLEDFYKRLERRRLQLDDPEDIEAEDMTTLTNDRKRITRSQSKANPFTLPSMQNSTQEEHNNIPYFQDEDTDSCDKEYNVLSKDEWKPERPIIVTTIPNPENSRPVKKPRLTYSNLETTAKKKPKRKKTTRENNTSKIPNQNKPISNKQNDFQQNTPSASCDIKQREQPFIDRSFILKAPKESNKKAIEYWSEVSNDFPMMIIECFKDQSGKELTGPKCPSFKGMYNGETADCQLTDMYISYVHPEYAYIFEDKDKPHGNTMESTVDEVINHPNRKRMTNVKKYAMNCTNNIPSGKNDHTPFVFMSGEDPAFKETFPSIRLDIPRFANYFLGQTQTTATAYQENQQPESQEINKGSRSHLRGANQYDIGLGPSHCAMSTQQSQQIHPNTTTPRSAFVNENMDELYEMIGPIADMLDDFVSKYCRTRNNTPAMQDPIVNQVAQDFTKKMKAKKSRWHASTVSWQQIAKIEKNSSGHKYLDYGIITDDEGNILRDKEGNIMYKYYQCLKRHIDGPNSRKEGFTFTAVYSILIVINGMVYRLSFIMYTRRSITTWVDTEHGYAIKMTNLLLQYKKESNGNISYHDWWLQDDMTHFKATASKFAPSHHLKDKVKRYVLMSEQDPQEQNHVPIEWVEHHDKKEGKLFEFIPLAEFICRYAYVSSYAWFIRCITKKYKLSRKHQMHLFYAALLSPSPILFATIITLWMKGKHSEWSWTDQSVNLMQKYKQTCLNLDLHVRGGLQQRFQGQSNNSWPEDDNLVQQQIDILEKNIHLLETDHTFKSYPQLPQGIEAVSNLSFASLALFTQLAKPTPLARERAMKGEVNPKSEYFHEMPKLAGCNEASTQKLKQPSAWSRLFYHIACRLGIYRGADIENGFCAIIRTTKRQDIFFKEQMLFSITADAVVVKEYGRKDWRNISDLE